MINIIAHNKVYFNNLYEDKSFDYNLYKFFLTEGRKDKLDISDIIKKEGFDVEKEWLMEEYNPYLQSNNFHAPSIFYHTHLNNTKFNDNYIGFLEYDLKLSDGFTKSVKEILNKHKEDKFLIFPSVRHKLIKLDNQRLIKISGKKWLKFFIHDYNKRYNTEYKYKTFLEKNKNELIPTQQSFICDIKTYDELSSYVFNFISEYPNRALYSPRPSTVLERFIGLFLFIKSLEYKNVYKIPLEHKHSSGGVY